MKFTAAIALLMIICPGVTGQEDSTRHRADTLAERLYILQKVYRDGESLPEIEIKEVNVIGRSRRSGGFQHWKYQRLIYNVRRAYPYAVIVRMRLEEVNSELEKLKDDKERREYLKNVEKDVFREYEDDMRELTFTQGKLLIKLIDRETKNTSYQLIKDYRGKIAAAFWQGIARIFGTNLKEEYDPYGEDAVIERIIEEIEAGRL